MNFSDNKIPSAIIRKIGGSVLLIGLISIILILTLSVFSWDTTAIISGISVLFIIAGSVMLMHKKVPEKIYKAGTIITLSILFLTSLIVHFQWYIEQITWFIYITGIASIFAPIFILLWVIES